MIFILESIRLAHLLRVEVFKQHLLLIKNKTELFIKKDLSIYIIIFVFIFIGAFTYSILFVEWNANPVEHIIDHSTNNTIYVLEKTQISETMRFDELFFTVTLFRCILSIFPLIVYNFMTYAKYKMGIVSLQSKI